jgi:glyoxylase-like metal-dependent hydrolase (beta-lactamase superfamily II)
MSSTSSASAPNRRSFLARSAAVAAVPAVAALAGGALAEPASAGTLPDYAPIPKSALGPAVNAQGYFVGRVQKNLYWVTDSTYQAAFLTTRDGVVLFDAPPTIGHNLQRAIDEVAAANGVSNKVTHIVYSHHHADHLGASSLFGRNARSSRSTPASWPPPTSTRPAPRSSSSSRSASTSASTPRSTRDGVPVTVEP